jgi:hypothetical protein
MEYFDTFFLSQFINHLPISYELLMWEITDPKS